MTAEPKHPDEVAADEERAGDAGAERLVRDDPDRQRYVLTVGGQEAGVVTYRRQGDRVVLEHTVIDTDRREKGLGSHLARAVLDDLRARGARLVPQCAFIARYVETHPEYADLVDA